MEAIGVDLSAAAQKLERMGRMAIEQLPNLVLAAVALLLFRVLANWVRRAVETVLTRARRPAPVPQVIGRLASWLVWLVGILSALTILVPSMNAASMFSALGIGGVAIGFAFKDIFQNLLAGLLLLVTRPFQIGDTIVAGALEGTVEDIQIRATRLRLLDGRIAMVPNSDLFTGRVVVDNARTTRRGIVDIGVAYDTDLALARDVILRTVRAVDGVLTKPAPDVVARTFGESTIDLQLRFWVGPPARRPLVQVTDTVIRDVKAALDEARIDIAFPTRVVMVQTPPNDPSSLDGADLPPGPEAPGERRAFVERRDALLRHGAAGA